MDNFSFNTPGLAGFERKLLDLGSTVARRGGRAALRQATNVVTLASREEAESHRDTGLTIKSIRTQDRGVRGDTIYFATVIDSRAFYARFVEYGTSHAPPYPFMRPAAERAAVPAIDRLATILGAWLGERWRGPA